MYKIPTHLLNSLKICLITTYISVALAYRSNYQHYKPEVDSNSKHSSSQHQTLHGRSLPERPPPVNPGQSRIVGGRLAEYGEANYQVYMYNQVAETDCGGSIVEINGLRFVITAAHCVWVCLKFTFHFKSLNFRLKAKLSNCFANRLVKMRALN